MKKIQQKKLGYALFVVLVLVLIIGAIYLQDVPKIEDGHLIREYSQIMKYLEKEPENITTVPYESNIPKIIQKDIKRMQESDKIQDIIYTNKERTMQIIISENNEGICIELHNYYVPYDNIDTNISFYKNGKSMVIYGSSKNNRSIKRYEIIDGEIKENASNGILEDSVDLFGVNQKYDDIRKYDINMTLIREGKSFMFYRLGKQVGKTEIFPGDDIVQFDLYYILDSNNDMYYLYYCMDTEDPWIQFVKVAEDIDEITFEMVSAKRKEKDQAINFVIYMKDGKKYAAISDLDTEWNYGQMYGKKIKLKDFEPDFSITTVEISDSNIKNCTLHRESTGGRYFDWFVRYNYQVEWKIVYTEERVNGLDSYISYSISERECLRFENREIKKENLEATIKRLKQVYARYE